MYGRFFPRALVGLLVVVLLAGVGIYAYQMGVAQGVAQGLPAGAAAADSAMRGPFWYPHPFFFPFGGLGCLAPLLLLFVFFGVMRMVFWRGHMMGHMGHGPWRGRWSEEGVPPMVEEWHKRMHEQKTDPTEPKPDTKPSK